MTIKRFKNPFGGTMRREIRDRINKALSKNHACYVLITCDAASDEGDMEVKMSYEGDAALASYLLQGAQTLIDDEIAI